MARKTELTWFAPRRCWKKYAGGKVFYFGAGQCRGKTDWEGYWAALEEWHRVERGLIRTRLPGRRSALTLPTRLDALAQDWESVRRTTMPLPQVEIASRSIEVLSQRFLAELRATKSAPMYETYKYKLADVLSFLADRNVCNVDQITEETIADFVNTHRQLLDHKSRKNRRSPYTCKVRIRVLKMFVKWLYRYRALAELPRNLDDRLEGFADAEPTPAHFERWELLKLLKASPSRRTKLYVLLALNCGYTQSDIASLEHSHIDWSNDWTTISRLRKKTRRGRSGIRQFHALWPSTARLLKQEMSDPSQSTLALLNEDGKPLRDYKVNADGSVIRLDTIKLAFDRAMLSAGLDAMERSAKGERRYVRRDRRRFGVLRKTAARLMRQMYPNDADLRDAFLSHGERRMEKHYADRLDVGKMAEACEMIGQHLFEGKTYGRPGRTSRRSDGEP